MKKVLDMFSHAFVINLDRNHERLASITQRLHGLGIGFERLPGVEFESSVPRAGARGCAMSHLGAVKEARDRGFESVLILEDDAIFRPDFPDLWSRLLPQMRGLDYDIFYGYDWDSRATSPSALGITPIAKTLCSHFWAIHSRFYDAFIETVSLNDRKEKRVSIDTLFSSGHARLYAPTYNLVGQDAGFSEVRGLVKTARWSAWT